MRMITRHARKHFSHRSSIDHKDSIEIHNNGLVTTHPWPHPELVVLCGSTSLYRHALDTNHSIYCRRSSAWHCPCPGSSIIENKRDLAATLSAQGSTADALMLPTSIVRSLDEVKSYPAILKPPGGYGGNGIEVVNGPDPLSRTFNPMVCTRLITDCLLYNGTHKADLRMFAILHPGTRRVLLYEGALVRCAQTPVLDGTMGAILTNSCQQILNRVEDSPPLLSHFEAYVPDGAHRERVYSRLLPALATVSSCVFAGKRIREKGFLMVGFDVLLNSDPYAAPIVLEYNVGWDREEDSDASRDVKRAAVRQLVKALVSKEPQLKVSVANW